MTVRELRDLLEAFEKDDVEVVVQGAEDGFEEQSIEDVTPRESIYGEGTLVVLVLSS